MFDLPNDWQALLEQEMDKPYFRELTEFLDEQYRNDQIFPSREDLFQALRLTSYENTKAVILGQDPYHGSGQAHGLSFSVRPGVAAPPSLKNILKEYNEDTGHPFPEYGCLTEWAEQGVLLLNTVLTVRSGEPNSHRNKGWEKFTDQIISLLNEKERPVVFILWGSPAQKKLHLINTEKHGVVASAHPSPLSARRGFFGSRPFSKANGFLVRHGLEPIDWKLKDCRQ